ncbi:MAG: hypothetical protein ACREDE_09885 [Thermoplasmata archaeon]
MNAAGVTEVGGWLESEIGVPFIVVGGSAIEQEVPVGTKDVDVLISEADWETVDGALENRKDASPLEPMDGTIRGTKLAIGGTLIDLEFLSPEPFSGTHPPGEFVRYVRDDGSKKRGRIRYAGPDVVFYMRLSTEHWQAYVPSIERDLNAGIDPATLDQVLALGDRFGVGERLRGRIQAVREVLRL